MTVVVDASVAVKWAIPEALSGRADALRAQADHLVAPGLLLSEAANALRKKLIRPIRCTTACIWPWHRVRAWPVTADERLLARVAKRRTGVTVVDLATCSSNRRPALSRGGRARGRKARR